MLSFDTFQIVNVDLKTSKNLDFKLRILNLSLMSNKSQNDWSTQIESYVDVKSRAKFQFFKILLSFKLFAQAC